MSVIGVGRGSSLNSSVLPSPPPQQPDRGAHRQPGGAARQWRVVDPAPGAAAAGRRPVAGESPRAQQSSCLSRDLMTTGGILGVKNVAPN